MDNPDISVIKFCSNCVHGDIAQSITEASTCSLHQTTCMVAREQGGACGSSGASWSPKKGRTDVRQPTDRA